MFYDICHKILIVTTYSVAHKKNAGKQNKSLKKGNEPKNTKTI